MSKRDEQIARMKGLMTYGMVTESKRTPVKDSIEGPDGKVYAIIREGAKYYIKSTNKGNDLVTESFEYIGGFMNKKNNEFSSYNQASKNLELKVRSLNEAYGVKKAVEVLNPEKKETLMVEMTDAMKASLARYRQIMNNAAGIMNESAAISMSNTGVPEAPKTSSFSPKLGEPFTNAAEAKLDSDLKATASDPEKQGEPFGDNKKAEENKDAQYVPDNSVANQKPTGGKVVHVNENAEYEETIEECDEWGSCGLPASAGVGEVGDDAPFTETLKEDNFFHNDSLSDDEQLEELPDEISLDEDEDLLDDEPVGFADDETTLGEGEEEEDINLDDLDLDLEGGEETEDPELDDMDTEETLDDESELEDDVKDEDNEIASLRAQVEELTALVNQLMGDEESDELEFDVEMDDEDDDFEDEDEDIVDFDMDDDIEFDEENDDLNEARKIVQTLVERVVDYAGGYTRGVNKDGSERSFDHFKPNNPKAREGEAFGNVQDDGSLSGANEKGIWWLAQEAIRGMDVPETLKSRAMGCLKNVYRCMINVDYLIENGADTDEISDMVDVMEEEMNKVNRLFAKTGMPCDAVNKIGDKVNVYIDKAYGVEELPEEPMDDDMDDELPEEPTPAKPKRDMDAENDEAAWAAAKNFDPSMFESRRARRINEEGTKLNVFGKHPGYRKKPMNLPTTGEDNNQWGRDWNDESVYSEQPFGQKVGDSAPFDDVVKATVDSLVESLKKKI